MGGFGSGGHNRAGCGTVEAHRSIDVMRLSRTGCLRPGFAGAWQWTYQNGERAWINMRAEAGALLLTYRWRQYGSDWESVEQRVPVIWVPCRFGGERPWFRCNCSRNGRYCGRRVAKLYGAGRVFACRHCYRLGYQSQLEQARFLPLHRSNKLRKRLGGDPGMAASIGPRRKGAHRAKYERTVAEIFRLEMLADDLLAPVLERFLRHGARSR